MTPEQFGERYVTAYKGESGRFSEVLAVEMSHRQFFDAPVGASASRVGLYSSLPAEYQRRISFYSNSSLSFLGLDDPLTLPNMLARIRGTLGRGHSLSLDTLGRPPEILLHWRKIALVATSGNPDAYHSRIRLRRELAVGLHNIPPFHTHTNNALEVSRDWYGL